MAVVSNCTVETAACEEQPGVDAVFDMVSLRTHLPLKRKGLSKYFSGKSRSFRRLGDAKSVEDLKKVEMIPEGKRRKYAIRRASCSAAASSCRTQSSIPSFDH